MDTPGTNNLVKSIDTYWIGKTIFKATQWSLIVVLFIGTHQVVDGISAIASGASTPIAVRFVASIEPVGCAIGLQSCFVKSVFLLDALIFRLHITFFIYNAHQDILLSCGCTGVVAVAGKDDQLGNSLMVIGITSRACLSLNISNANLETFCLVRP